MMNYHSYVFKINFPSSRHVQSWAAHQGLTPTEVSEHVVALFREGHLVDGVSDVTGLQQVSCVLASFAAVGETFHVTVEPVHHI